MLQILRCNRIFGARLKSAHFLEVNFNQGRLGFQRILHFGDSKRQDIERDDIWRELKIEWMRPQLSIPALAQNDKLKLNQRLAFEKFKLIQTLRDFQNDVLKDEQFIDKLQHFQLTPHKLSNEIEALCQTIERHACQQKSTYSFIHYYKSFNEVVKNAQKHAHLTRLSYIMQMFIKLKYFLIVNQVSAGPNILNSCPSQNKDVWKKIKYVELDGDKIQQDYTKFVINLHTLVGIFQSIDMANQSFLRTFFQVPYRLLYGLTNYRSKILKSFRFFNQPNTYNIQLLNRIEQGTIGKILESQMPKITTNKMIYIPSRGDFKEGIDIFQPNQHSIPVRILYNKQLPGLTSKQCIQQALVHMHGGGNILFSSFIAQNHTRLWANQAGVLIFSIDYKLAPKHPFPHAVEDCLQVYRFLTNEIHKYLNVKLKRTFIGGDSAGGNISCALVALILKNKLLKPSSIFLIYPSLDLQKIYYPSRQYFLIDPVLWPSFALLVVDSYIKDHKEAQNPLVTPLLLTQEFISGKEGDKSFPKEWPTTKIIVGMKDPLRDESLLLMEKLTKSGIDCECTILQGFRHGFMNTDQHIRQSQIPFKLSVEIVKGMVETARKE